METLTPTYLTKQRINLNSGNFWAAWVDNDEVIIHKGILNGRPRIVRQSFDSPKDAVRHLEKAILERKSSGFVETAPPQDYASVRVHTLPPAVGVGSLDNLQYSMYWGVRDEPIRPAVIVEAFNFCRYVLQRFDGFSIPTMIELVEDQLGPRVRFSAPRERDLWFGFAPAKEYLNLAEPERAGLEQFKTGWRGWLTPNGYGEGHISTGRGWNDFLVRLFLNKLCPLNPSDRSFTVSCDLNLVYRHCFGVQDELSEFAWYQSRDEICSVLNTFGFLHSQDPVSCGLKMAAIRNTGSNFTW